MSIMDNADKITKEDIKEVPHIDDIGARLSRDQIKKKLTSRQDDKKTDAELRKEYTKRKAHAMLLEESNDHSIIVFKSIEEPWHKIGWNSALIYAYDVAIRACKKKELPTIRPDDDLDCRSPEGVIFVRKIEKFIERLRNIGINKYELTNDGIYVFDVNRTYTKEEIKEFRNTKYRLGDELFAMAASKKVYPNLRGLIAKAEAVIFPKLKSMNSFYRETICNRIGQDIVEMNAAYFELANRRGNKKEHFINIVRNANDILALVDILQEIDAQNPVANVQIGSIMVDIKSAIHRILSKEKEEKNVKTEGNSEGQDACPVPEEVRE